MGRHKLFVYHGLVGSFAALDAAKAKPRCDERTSRAAERICQQTCEQTRTEQVDDGKSRDGTKGHTYAQEWYQFQFLPQSSQRAAALPCTPQKRTSLRLAIPKIA
ncbi:hypothetical protein [uncultured Paracoccus sp.]|uniref:hypothetical protein n=1 Tax=uncultured Paracoccus sp. TaxID=189685 RepID=UPI00261270B5|nr:hypothetical protein [uncultured Paracoccus sp.]